MESKKLTNEEIKAIEKFLDIASESEEREVRDAVRVLDEFLNNNA